MVVGQATGAHLERLERIDDAGVRIQVELVIVVDAARFGACNEDTAFEVDDHLAVRAQALQFIKGEHIGFRPGQVAGNKKTHRVTFKRSW